MKRDKGASINVMDNLQNIRDDSKLEPIMNTSFARTKWHPTTVTNVAF